MGIDIDGGMIVGGQGLMIQFPDDIESETEWAYENGMESMPMHYDADSDWCFYGFSVANIRVSEIDDAWLTELKDKAELFEKLTGVEAMLIGTQKVW